MGFRPVQKQQRAGGPFARIDQPEVRRTDQIGGGIGDGVQQFFRTVPPADSSQPQCRLPSARVDYRVAGVAGEQFVQRPERLRQAWAEGLPFVPGHKFPQPVSKLPGSFCNTVQFLLVFRRPESCRDVCLNQVRLFQPVAQAPSVLQPLDRNVLGGGNGIEKVDCGVVADEEGRGPIGGHEVSHRYRQKMDDFIVT